MAAKAAQFGDTFAVVVSPDDGRNVLLNGCQSTGQIQKSAVLIHFMAEARYHGQRRRQKKFLTECQIALPWLQLWVAYNDASNASNISGTLKKK